MTYTLVLVRHGQSEWNKLNLFTGWRDPDLTEQGVAEAIAAGQRLKSEGFHFDKAYTSMLQRANRTLALLLSEMDQSELETVRDERLNERDYGDLSGKNKDEARAEFGEEQVHIWRRSYDVPPPGGESLKDTGDRVVPYYSETIWPDLADGKTIVIAAHGNSIRALIKHLEDLTAEEILRQEVATGVPIVYELDEAGKVVSRRDLTA
jgi:2,3-bisphosphoglycerate-dependent phosphoglycerate mutase